MSKIAALYGAGSKSLVMEKILSEYLGDIDVQYAIENKVFSKIGTKIQCISDKKKTLDIISLHTLQAKYAAGEIDMVIFPSSYHLFDIREIIKLCLSIGIKKGDVYTVPVDVLRKGKLDNDDISHVLIQYDKLEQFYHLDIHIVDNCNLNCKACAHFAPLAPEDTQVNISTFKENLGRLKTLIPYIDNIAVLGGEPLLHPELKEILQFTRKAYPYADISLVTNGIRLLNMSIDLIEELRNDNIAVTISLYPILKMKLEVWLEFLRKNRLQFSIREFGQFERRLIPQPLLDGGEMTQKCGHVLVLRENRIGRCPLAMFTDYFNKKFGAILPETRGIDIFEIQSGLELIDKLERPIALCNYCTARDHYYEDWESMHPAAMKPEDWFMKLPKGIFEKS